MIEGKELARAASQYADNKQADDITILDLRGISTITDFFMICSGGSKPHLKAIRREIREKLKQDHGVIARSVDGQTESQWMVLDYGDVIVHVFHNDRRDFFALEDLWSDAPVIDWATGEETSGSESVESPASES